MTIYVTDGNIKVVIDISKESLIKEFYILKTFDYFINNLLIICLVNK